MAARRGPRRNRDHPPYDPPGSQPMQLVHGRTRQHRRTGKPMPGVIRMAAGRERTERRLLHQHLRSPLRRGQDRSHLDGYGDQPSCHVAGTGQDDTTRESERGMEERLLPRIPGGDRPQIRNPPAGDGIGRRRQGTRHRPRQPGRPMGRKTRHLQRQSAETLQAHGIQPVGLPARKTGRGTPGHRTQGDRQGRRLGSGKV